MRCRGSRSIYRTPQEMTTTPKHLLQEMHPEFRTAEKICRKSPVKNGGLGLTLDDAVLVVAFVAALFRHSDEAS